MDQAKGDVKCPLPTIMRNRSKDDYLQYKCNRNATNIASRIYITIVEFTSSTFTFKKCTKHTASGNLIQIMEINKNEANIFTCLYKWWLVTQLQFWKSMAVYSWRDLNQYVGKPAIFLNPFYIRQSIFWWPTVLQQIEVYFKKYAVRKVITHKWTNSNLTQQLASIQY